MPALEIHLYEMWDLVYKNHHVTRSSAGMQFPGGQGRISFFRCMCLWDLWQYYHQQNLLTDFLFSTKNWDAWHVLKTTHMQYHQRYFCSCFQNQNEQNQVIKSSCGETLQLIQRGKIDESIIICKRIMHFCKNNLKLNKRTRILLDSSGKTKAVALAFLAHFCLFRYPRCFNLNHRKF